MDADVTKGPLSTDYLKINKLGLVPSFVGADGYELTECIAIAIYSMSLVINWSVLLYSYTYLMRSIINYSYPCLKTTVEAYSHSDTILHLLELHFNTYGSEE